MNQLDILYRAFADYKKQTAQNRECSLEQSAVAFSNPENDIIDVVKTICKVDEDWIIAIEKGLVHIEKAINEGRQFIRSNGEVVPIEKVKRVSKESVEHLAKHSDFITRKIEGEDLVPDKLYMVERLSDFAVYENRFLYMLLCYLKSFISLRYNKILELSGTYSSDIKIKKLVAMNKRKIVFDLKMREEKQDDAYLKANNELAPIIDRIDMLLKSVMFFLSTPLMQEVSKSQLLKPPITKTNVLKMNNNFKGAVEVYDFVTAYDKVGYEIEKRIDRINPFSEDVALEFAHLVSLTSFLSYVQGIGLTKSLETSFRGEEERRKTEEFERQKEQLIKLKKRIAESGSDPTEYIALLEKHNKALEVDIAKIPAMNLEIEKLNAEKDVLNENINSLNASIGEKQSELETIGRKHFEEITEIKAEHDNIIVTIKKQISEIQNQMIVEKEDCRKQIVAAEKENLKKSNELAENYSKKIGEFEKANEKRSIEFENLLNAKALVDSRFNALRKEHNLIGEDEDFTAKESFADLERQLKVFKSFFKDQWRQTKKTIRKKILKANPDAVKNKSEDEEEKTDKTNMTD